MSDKRIITLVILPPEREDDITDLAAQWSRAWLLSPALWSRAIDVHPDTEVNPHAPPIVNAKVIGRNGATEVDLFAELGRHEYDLVRVVAVRSVEEGEAYNPFLDDALEVIRGTLNASKPAKTRLQYINVICSPTYQAGASSSRLIESGWSVNIVASPESRPTPNSFDAFTRHSDRRRWTGFMLAHLATAGGLWSTLPEGPYDDAEPSGIQDAVQLQRLAIRGVLTGGLVVNVSLEAMRMATRDQSALAGAMMSVDESDLHLMGPSEEDAAVSDLVRIAMELDAGSLRYRAPGNPTPVTRSRLGFFSQARDLIAFSWDKVIDTPGWFTRRAQSKASRKATAALHGESGEAVVDVGGQLSREDIELANELESLDQLRQAALARLDEPVPALRYDVNVSLWDAIRRSSFALLDGSRLPEGSALTPVIQAGPTSSVVSSVSALYPDWKEVWAPPTEVVEEARRSSRLAESPQDWLDLSFTNEWASELSRRTARLLERESKLRARLGAVSADITALDELLVDLEDSLIAAEEDVDWVTADLEDLLADLGALEDGPQEVSE